MKLFEKKKKKKQKKVIMRSMQDVLDFEGIAPDGMLKGDGFFSVVYEVSDANFITEPENVQIDMLKNYTKICGRFPDNMDVSFVIRNIESTKEQLAKNFHIPPSAWNKEQEEYRLDYNEIIDDKIKRSQSEYSKKKYIILTIHTNDEKKAISAFALTDDTLNDALKSINYFGAKRITAPERAEIMYEVLNGVSNMSWKQLNAKYIDQEIDAEGNYYDIINTTKLRKSGQSIKNTLCPDMMRKLPGMSLQLGEERFVKSFIYSDLPLVIDSGFLTKTTNLPNEMVTVIQLRTVPGKTARRWIKVASTSIKADHAKATKAAYKEGYDPSLINPDIIQASESISDLYEDVMHNGKRLLYATMSVTIIGKSEEHLKQIEEQFRSSCQDYSLNPRPTYGATRMKALNSAILTGNSDLKVDRMLTSDNVAALNIFDIQELQEKDGTFYGSNQQSNNIIVVNRKKSHIPHALVTGQTGSGKSFIVKNEILSNYLRYDDDIIILDPEDEYIDLATKLGGESVELNLTANNHMNPLDLTMEWDDPNVSLRQLMAEKCDFMVGLVETIFERPVTPTMRSCIHRVTSKIYEPYIKHMQALQRQGSDIKIDYAKCPTLVDFYNALDDERGGDANVIKSTIEPFCIGYSDIFAHHTNIDTNSRLITINMKKLPDNMRNVAMKVCLVFMWNKIQDNFSKAKKSGIARSTWLYFDEFHLFFDNLSTISTLKAYWKRCRKFGACLCGISQEISDLFQKREGEGIFSNTGFFLFMKQSVTSRNHISDLWHCSEKMLSYIDDKVGDVGKGIIKTDSAFVPFDFRIPSTSMCYKLFTTKYADLASNESSEKNEGRFFGEYYEENKSTDTVEAEASEDDELDDSMFDLDVEIH